MTNTSLTAVHAMVSTPFFLSCSASSTKPGKCFASQVGVNAPGTENSTTVFPPNSSSVLTFFGPSLDMVVNLPAGILSPTLMVMWSFSVRKLRLGRLGAELVGVQLPQLQHSRTDVRHLFQAVEGLLRFRVVFQCDLRPAEIDVGLVEVLDPFLLDTPGDGGNRSLVVAGPVVDLARLDVEFARGILGRLGVERGLALLVGLGAGFQRIREARSAIL